MEIPSEMLYRNGIAMIAINAGIASVMSLKSILVTDVSIRNPTMIRAGAVAKDGIARKIGDNSSDNPKRMAAIREVSPVRPPSATPEALSTKVVTVEVPHIAPTVVPTASERRAPLMFGSLPSLSSISALEATPIRFQSIEHIYKQECKHNDYEIKCEDNGEVHFHKMWEPCLGWRFRLRNQAGG